MKKRTTKHIGDLSELRFALEAKQRRISVSVPWGDNDKYDFITDGQTGLKKVQVKTARYISSGDNGPRYTALLAHGCNQKGKYTKQDIDFFAVYASIDWYIIPVEKIHSIRIALYPEGKKMYEKYKNQWQLL